MTTDPDSVDSLGKLHNLDSLRKQAKQWLKALRGGDDAARDRFRQHHLNPPANPGLRDVQHALARELGFASWATLKAAITRSKVATQTPLQSLLEAAGKGDVERVKSVLDVHPGIINEREELPGTFGKRTALHYGIDHAAVVRLLLERGADPNVRDDGDDAMPLHFAAEHQDLEVIKLLVEHGADTVGDGTMHELDVLGWATAWDYVQAKPEVVQYLLEHGARYSIHSAVALGAIDELRAIVARDPDVLNRPMDAANQRRRPLHLAITKRQRESLVALLELGADTEARDRSGLTPLDQAALGEQTEYAQLLIEHDARLELPAAVALGRTADIERLMAADPDCLRPGARWGALIVRAAERAPAAVIETLLRFGASPNARDDGVATQDRPLGTTALHLAAFRGNADAVRVLLAHGADPARRESEHGSTPLGWAAYAGQEATRQLLLAMPFDIFDAIVTGNEARVIEILNKDAQALHRTFGETTGLENQASYATPLVWAVGHNKPALAKLLIERGAVALTAPDGETMLDHALEHGYGEIAALLQNEQAHDAPAAYVWAEAERALRDGDAQRLERLLQHNEALFRRESPPATDVGSAPDYSAMEPREIIRLNHQFDSWEDYLHFRRQLKIAMSPETRFEAAADAIVQGKINELRWLLQSHPSLVNERSARRHRATLLQYTAPTELEYFRQRVPANSDAVAQLLTGARASAGLAKK